MLAILLNLICYKLRKLGI